MALADRCNLLIPFKTWTDSMVRALEGVEGVDVGVLRAAASREFENLKAIERRINDESCDNGGGEEVMGFATALFVDANLADNDEFNSGVSGFDFCSYLYTTHEDLITVTDDNSVQFPAGTWDITFRLVISAPAGDQFPGGYITVSLNIGVNGAQYVIDTEHSGGIVFYYNSAFYSTFSTPFETIGLSVFNETNQVIDTINLDVTAHRITPDRFGGGG